jgi:EAL domain-containing protein (putative c-di-GMP-specific phosphodiesterase class I)
LDALRPAGSRLTVPGGETLFTEGSVGKSAYVIESGRVEISVSRGGRKVVLGNRGAGEVIGEMAMIDARPRSATVKALERSEFLVLTEQQIRKRIRHADPVLRMCLNMIVDRFRRTLRDLTATRVADEEAGPEPAPEVGAAGADLELGYKQAIHEVRLERDLEDALENNEFELHFQPIMELDAMRVAGFEGLIRWRHPERGMVPPDQFLPTAEAGGLIVQISHWVLRSACEFLQELQRALPGRPPDERPFVAINLSGVDVTAPRFSETIVAIARNSGVPFGRVKLELTETVLMSEPDLAARALNALKRAGFSIAIDDFGTGYSSLSYLHKYPFDTLKIDRAFIAAMGESTRMARLVRAIVTLATELDMANVAEGIETEAQADACRALGCRYGQGFLFSRPLPANQALDFMRDREAPSVPWAASMQPVEQVQRV